MNKRGFNTIIWIIIFILLITGTIFYFKYEEFSQNMDELDENSDGESPEKIIITGNVILEGDNNISDENKNETNYSVP